MRLTSLTRIMPPYIPSSAHGRIAPTSDTRVKSPARRVRRLSSHGLGQANALRNAGPSVIFEMVGQICISLCCCLSGLSRGYDKNGFSVHPQVGRSGQEQYLPTYLPIYHKIKGSPPFSQHQNDLRGTERCSTVDNSGVLRPVGPRVVCICL